MQGHLEAFAKTLITLLKMLTMSRMLQSTYCVCNTCVTVQSINCDRSVWYENVVLALMRPSHATFSQEQYEPQASSPSSVWGCCSLEVCA